MKLCINPLSYSHKKLFNDIRIFVKFHFATKFSSIFLIHGKHSLEKVINEVLYQPYDPMKFIQQTHIYILHQAYEFHLSHAAG